MGRHGKYPWRHHSPDRAVVSGSFVTVAADDPTTVRGTGYSVARTAAGRYTVTLDEAAVQIETILCNAHPETLTNEGIVCFVDQDTIDTNSFEIRLLTSADVSATNLALDDDAGAEIHFMAVVKNTSY